MIFFKHLRIRIYSSSCLAHFLLYIMFLLILKSLKQDILRRLKIRIYPSSCLAHFLLLVDFLLILKSLKQIVLRIKRVSKLSTKTCVYQGNGVAGLSIASRLQHKSQFSINFGSIFFVFSYAITGELLKSPPAHRAAEVYLPRYFTDYWLKLFVVLETGLLD